MVPLSPSAVFSPSIARQQLAAQKDWNYVDNWLSAKFNGKTPPPFERNNDTLKALLALAGLNEAADEERELLAKAQVKALRDLQENEDANTPRSWLHAIEEALGPEGQASLETQAQLSLVLNQPTYDITKLARNLVDLHKTSFDLDQIISRLSILANNLNKELERVLKVKEGLDSQEYEPRPDLEKQSVDYQRRTKLLAAKLPELRQRIPSLSGTTGTSKVTIRDVKGEEDTFRDAMAAMKELDAQVRTYHGLPQDTDLARLELETLRVELRDLTRQRDNMFEGLVERESPKKNRS